MFASKFGPVLLWICQIGQDWTPGIHRAYQAKSSQYVFSGLPFQPWQYSRSRFLHYCVYIPPVHTTLEVQLVQNTCPPVLCKFAVSARRSASWLLSFRGSVRWHGTFHGRHMLWSLGCRVKCTHYRVSSFSQVKFTLFFCTHSLAKRIFTPHSLAWLSFTFSLEGSLHSAHYLPSRKFSADWTRTNVLCFRKVLLSREGDQLHLNTANNRSVRNISPLHQS